MLNGNPNAKLRVTIPQPENSRYAQGRSDLMGLGVESLQGGALQSPVKINSIPGFGNMQHTRQGLPTLSPQLQRLLAQRRTANAATQQRRGPAPQRPRSPREELGF